MKELLNKSYNWEDSYDLERDIHEAVTDGIPETEGRLDEWQGQIKVVITYIPEP